MLPKFPDLSSIKSHPAHKNLMLSFRCTKPLSPIPHHKPLTLNKFSLKKHPKQAPYPKYLLPDTSPLPQLSTSYESSITVFTSQNANWGSSIFNNQGKSVYSADLSEYGELEEEFPKKKKVNKSQCEYFFDKESCGELKKRYVSVGKKNFQPIDKIGKSEEKSGMEKSDSIKKFKLNETRDEDKVLKNLEEKEVRESQAQTNDLDYEFHLIYEDDDEFNTMAIFQSKCIKAWENSHLEKMNK